MHNLFATAPLGVEDLVSRELQALGASACEPTRAGVRFCGDLAVAYKACLWSRLASRILLPLATFPAATPEALYDGLRTVPWHEHLAADGTLAVDFSSRDSAAFTHSHYGALKSKDAIVDLFRERTGGRPAVDTQAPDLRINVHVAADVATVSLDLSGESLHRRHYRARGAEAPLKENLAAAVLSRSGWPAAAAAGQSLLDPMCGSGTLLIEAALMAADWAPGLLRRTFGFHGWRKHDAALWRSLREDAEARRRAGLERLPRIAGSDVDPRMVASSRANVAEAGLAEHIQISRADACELPPPPGPGPGFLVLNPPYGERLGETAELVPLYARLGQALRRHAGWEAHVLVADLELGRALGLRATRKHTLYNGALTCTLLHIPIFEAPSRPQGCDMLANRLRKNRKKLLPWLQRHGITCYRLYDADLPEYAVAIDVYDRWVHVQEYEPPKSIDPRRAQERLRRVLLTLPGALDVAPGDIFLKVRRRQRGTSQYTRQDDRQQFHEVQENGCRYGVNFTDYLDTGIFLDHRPVRALIQQRAAGQHFLNLFAYTGTASVSAAVGAAASTTTVDMSHTYLDWAARNLRLNGFGGPQHALVQADCLTWIDTCEARYDLIFLDPPTFSNSKRMRDTFDVQRDHVDSIRRTARLLSPGGTLIFSTNARRFDLDAAALAPLQVRDISAASIPLDFARNPRVHRCFEISRPQPARPAGRSPRPRESCTLPVDL